MERLRTLRVVASAAPRAFMESDLSWEPAKVVVDDRMTLAAHSGKSEALFVNTFNTVSRTARVTSRNRKALMDYVAIQLKKFKRVAVRREEEAMPALEEEEELEILETEGEEFEPEVIPKQEVEEKQPLRRLRRYDEPFPEPSAPEASPEVSPLPATPEPSPQLSPLPSPPKTSPTAPKLPSVPKTSPQPSPVAPETGAVIEETETKLTIITKEAPAILNAIEHLKFEIDLNKVTKANLDIVDVKDTLINNTKKEVESDPESGYLIVATSARAIPENARKLMIRTLPFEPLSPLLTNDGPYVWKEGETYAIYVEYSIERELISVVTWTRASFYLYSTFVPYFMKELHELADPVLTNPLFMLTWTFGQPNPKFADAKQLKDVRDAADYYESMPEEAPRIYMFTISPPVLGTRHSEGQPIQNKTPMERFSLALKNAQLSFLLAIMYRRSSPEHSQTDPILIHGGYWDSLRNLWSPQTCYMIQSHAFASALAFAEDQMKSVDFSNIEFHYHFDSPKIRRRTVEPRKTWGNPAGKMLSTYTTKPVPGKLMRGKEEFKFSKEKDNQYMQDTVYFSQEKGVKYYEYYPPFPSLPFSLKYKNLLGYPVASDPFEPFLLSYTKVKIDYEFRYAFNDARTQLADYFDEEQKRKRIYSLERFFHIAKFMTDDEIYPKGMEGKHAAANDHPKVKLIKELLAAKSRDGFLDLVRQKEGEHMRKDWVDNTQLQVLYYGLRKKLADETFKTLLLQTNGMNIVYDTISVKKGFRDDILGNAHPFSQDLEAPIGDGRNYLGQMLMIVRDELISGVKLDSFVVYQKPANFFLAKMAEHKLSDDVVTESEFINVAYIK